MPTTPLPTFEAQKAGCCSGEDAAAKTPLLIFPMAGLNVSCCPGEEPSDPPAASGTETTGRAGNGANSIAFRIEGMACSCEGQMVEKRVRGLKGIKSFSLNPITNQMRVTYDPSAISVKDIETAVKKAGARAVLAT
jgi:copper chaperone CopZ